jgi:thioredoxin-related protein
MKKRFLIVLIFAFAALVSCKSDKNQKSANNNMTPTITETSLFFVAEYDPSRDPFVDVQNAAVEAQKSKRRILLDVGGDWCSWCHILDDFIEQNADIKQALKEAFVIVKVNYSDANFNDAFFQQYPPAPGYPHFYILESDGTFLHSQNTVELEEEQSYNPTVFMNFIGEWSLKS